MTQSTDKDIKYITDLLVELKSDLKETNKKIDNLNSEIVEIKSTINSIDKRLAIAENSLTNQQKAIDKIPDLAEKVGELKNWRQIAVIIITGTASTVFGWFLRSGR